MSNLLLQKRCQTDKTKARCQIYQLFSHIIVNLNEIKQRRDSVFMKGEDLSE